MSFVLQAEQRGRAFCDTDGTQKSPWQIFRDHGWNWARLMICNEPSRLGQGLDYVLAGAKKLQEYGYHFALDFMMSDGWSNPMTQPTPASLADLTHAERVKAWHDYVYKAVSALKAQGTAPEIVQVGNEISNGAFWPTGRVFYGEEKRARSSDEDIENLWGDPDPERVYREHIAPRCPNYICTKGAQPAEVFSPGVHAVFPTEPVAQVLSTIGAGDNFNAGIAYGILRNAFTRERILRLSEADWDLLVPTAMRFSAAVCGSLQNYVEPDFWRNL